MAKKYNCIKNGVPYFRKTKTIGHEIDGTPIKKEFYGDGEKDCDRLIEEYIETVKSGITQVVNSTLGYLINDWLWNVKRNSSNFKSSSFDRYERIVRLDIIPSEIAKRPLKDITPHVIQKYYNKLYNNGTPQNKIKDTNKVLSNFFNYCRKQGWSNINPASKELIELPGESDIKLVIDDEDEDIKIFDDETRLKIIDACKNMKDTRLIKIHTIILLALATGMREGEILGLSSKHLDLENKEIRIRKTLEKINIYNDNNEIIGHDLKLTDPKTKESVRTIPLPDFIIPYLDNYPKGSIVIFESESGNFIDPRNLARAWERFLKRNNIEYLNFHALRRTYASLLFSKGATLKEVQNLLGHSDIETTEKIYISVTKTDKQKRVTQINDLFI